MPRGTYELRQHRSKDMRVSDIVKEQRLLRRASEDPLRRRHTCSRASVDVEPTTPHPTTPHLTTPHPTTPHSTTPHAATAHATLHVATRHAATRLEARSARGDGRMAEEACEKLGEKLGEKVAAGVTAGGA
jgi:hypothetical protein